MRGCSSIINQDTPLKFVNNLNYGGAASRRLYVAVEEMLAFQIFFPKNIEYTAPGLARLN